MIIFRGHKIHLNTTFDGFTYLHIDSHIASNTEASANFGHLGITQQLGCFMGYARHGVFLRDILFGTEYDRLTEPVRGVRGGEQVYLSTYLNRRVATHCSRHCAGSKTIVRGVNSDYSRFHNVGRFPILVCP